MDEEVNEGVAFILLGLDMNEEFEERDDTNVYVRARLHGWRLTQNTSQQVPRYYGDPKQNPRCCRGTLFADGPRNLLRDFGSVIPFGK